MAYGKHNQSGIIFVISLILNLFTVLLAVPSLEERPIEVPDLKSLRFLPLFAGARERTSTRMHRYGQ